MLWHVDECCLPFQLNATKHIELALLLLLALEVAHGTGYTHHMYEQSDRDTNNCTPTPTHYKASQQFAVNVAATNNIYGCVVNVPLILL